MTRTQSTPEHKRKVRRVFWTIVMTIAGLYVFVPLSRTPMGILLLLLGFSLVLLAGLSSTIIAKWGNLLPEDMTVGKAELWAVFGIGTFIALLGVLVMA